MSTAKVPRTITNPDFIKALHENTTEDDHAVIILKIKLTRTKKSYKENIEMHSFPDGLYECLSHFGVNYETFQSNDYNG